MKTLTSTPTQRNTVELLQVLPAMPKIAQEILSIKLANDHDDELLLKLIEKDPAIMARIIGLANSPLFGTSRKIMSASDAATVLGIKRIKMIALSFAMISSIAPKQPGLLDVARLWKHSMTIALALDVLSRAMPRDMRPAEDDLYLSGLLLNIGYLVLEYIDPEQSNKFHARLAAEGGQLAAQLETEILEMNHCELGALLAQHWNLPETIVAVLLHHHSDDVAADAVGQPMITMSHLAERLLPTFSTTEPGQSGITSADWQSLGIFAEHEAEVEAAIRKRAEESAAALG